MNRGRVAQLIREVDALDHDLAMELALEIIEAPGNDIEAPKAKRGRRAPRDGSSRRGGDPDRKGNGDPSPQEERLAMTTRDMRNIMALPSGHFRVRFKHQGGTFDAVVDSYEEAIGLRDETKRQIIDGEMLPAKGVSARDLRGLFLGSRNGNRSVDNDSSRWDNHVGSAAWARSPVYAVTRADGNAWLKSLKRKRLAFDPERHRVRPEGFLGWQTRKHCLNLARSFFDWAIAEERYGIDVNPFAGLTVPKEDGDEDEGYQEGWYLDPSEQTRFFGIWDSPKVDMDAGDRWEKLVVQFAVGTGLRRGELWCLHLEDVHVGARERQPRVEVRYGSWDAVKQRYRAPKGRKGEKKKRTVYLHGLALAAARAWLAQLPIYAAKNPLGLMFPTERGKRRTGNLRSWDKAVEAFGVLPRLGRKVWFHLLRHTCASSLISGWWGMRWSLEEVSKVLGHTDVRTTQMYAHLAPSAMQDTALRAQAAFLASRPGIATAVATVPGTATNSPEKSGTPGVIRTHDIRLRRPRNHSVFLDENQRRAKALSAICHVLSAVADGALVLTTRTVRDLEFALERLQASDTAPKIRGAR